MAVDDSIAAELLIPHDRYDVVAKLHTVGQVRSQETQDDGVYILGRYPAKHRSVFDPFIKPAAKAKKPATKRAVKK